MSTPAYNLPALIDRAGFARRAGAPPSAIAELEKIFGFQMSDEFSQLWALSDGMSSNRMEILSVSEIEKYAGVFEGGFDFIPFADCNDSNPYAIYCRDPLRGMVAHIYHDGDTALVCRGLGRFFELVAAARASDNVDRIEGDLAFEHPDRLNEHNVIARELVRVAQNMEPRDYWRGIALQFAAQLFGPGQEDDLANVMAVGDEYTREAVRKRWRNLGTGCAQELLRKDDSAYQAFLVEFRNALEAEGLQTRSDGFGKYTVEPGNHGLNFAMLFAKCRQPGAIAECVQRIAKW